VRFIPRRDQIIGRVVIQRRKSAVVRPDETRDTTKLILVDAVGPIAAAAGIRVGDVVLPNAMGNIVLDGGVSFRPILSEANVLATMVGLRVEEMLIQVEGATKFVPFGDAEAAQSLAESPPPDGPSGAA
jgi:hypothetical protein